MNNINKVLISGGTHGNEYTGAYFVKNFACFQHKYKNYSFDIETILSNPKAYHENRRYIDQDLNRTFKQEQLLKQNTTYESQRAREINKHFHNDISNHVDVIFDLHSTTANMGASLILTKKDQLTLKMAAFIMQRDPSVKSYAWIREGIDEGFFVDMAPHGFAIEVGPIAQGTLNAEIFLRTQQVLQMGLEFLQLYNEDLINDNELSLSIYEHQEMIDFPRNDKGEIIAMIHPNLQNQDYQLLKTGDPIFLFFDDKVKYWEGEPVYPVFINEAAYYEKGIAFSVTKKNIIHFH